MDIRVSRTNLFGEWLYRVYVDETKYNQFFSSDRLTDAELYDVAQGYTEALSNYRSAMK